MSTMLFLTIQSTLWPFQETNCWISAEGCPKCWCQAQSSTLTRKQDDGGDLLFKWERVCHS